MDIKLDECIDARLASLLREHGHDAATAYEQGLSGSADRNIYDLCRKENRILLTQDLDFANPYVYPPHGTPGIIVIRNPGNLLAGARELLARIAVHLQRNDPHGLLWVVGYSGIRVWSKSDK